MLTFPPNGPGLAANPLPEVHPYPYGVSDTQPLPETQGFHTSETSSFDLEPPPPRQPPPPTRHRSYPAAATRTLQNPAEGGCATRRSHRAARAHNPVRGQRATRPREGGRGRTKGAPNYKPREVLYLLGLVDDELPIASKGWKVVGSLFREWAAVAEFPARTDRSLELKFKQVRLIYTKTQSNHLQLSF